MKYLLIDFGATYIKCAVYDKEVGKISLSERFTSPFVKQVSITSKSLYELLDSIVVHHEKVDGVIICTILGGTWHNGVYYSWKAGLPPGQSCLIGGLFGSVSHKDHKPFTTANKYVDELVIIGNLHQTPIYSALGDTDCVIRSLDLTEGEVAVNIGTGSQVITTHSIQRFFPAGRSFLVYQELFESLGLDIFELIDRLTIDDVINSPIEANLATFEQAKGYASGGSITNIREGGFSAHNLLGSLVRALVTQYRDAIGNAKRIVLVGGMSKRLKLIQPLFNHYYPQATTSLAEQGIESTHKGMIRYINEQL